jgi:site-specific recombinase XerD
LTLVLEDPRTGIRTRALSNLLETCRSKATQISYIKGINYFMDFIGLERGAYDKLLEKDHKDIQQLICSWISELKRSKSSSTISTYIAGLTKFFTMNDIVGINWARVHNYEPEKTNISFDRPHYREEIQQLIDKADYRNRAIILLMSSSGVRVGALPSLKIRDLIPIDQGNHSTILSLLQNVAQL